MRISSRELLRGLLIAGAFGVLVAAYGAFEILAYGRGLAGVLPVIGSFGCLGLLLGSIYAFDSESEIKVAERPVLRVVLAVVAGLSLSLLWHWPPEGAALSVLTSGMLGYFGMAWAKYVDF